MVVVSLDLQASQEKEVRRERPALQGCLCQVLPDVPALLVPRVHQGPLDLQAFLRQDKTASLESLVALVCREKEVTQESQARKVRRETPV